MTHLDDAEAAFVPPFCPRPDCRHHRPRPGWRWCRNGFHERKAAPHRVQRFLCLACGRSFSTQTFRTTYWLKRPELLPQVFHLLFSCGGYRQVGDALRCSHSTVLNQTRRLGRHCLLFEQAHGPPGPPRETLVLDGLRSFELSQYWPFDLNHVSGARSHYLYGFSLSELRRSGTMTRRQRARRAELERRHGRPHPKATERQVEALLRRITGGPCGLTLESDEHRGYERALARMERDGWRVDHGQTSSKASRTPANPLWPANLLDLLIRHGGANHKRETIAFSKRAQAVLHRAAVFQVMRNWVRGVRVADGARSPSPAMRLGLAARRLSVEEVLVERLFPSRVRLPADLRQVYQERVPTRQLARLRRHELKLAA